MGDAMSPDIANNERDLLKLQARFLRVVIVSQVGVILALIVTLAINIAHRTTVIVPPEVRRPYEIGADYVNKDYLFDMAGYVLSTAFTVTPENVDYNEEVILKMTEPEGYPELKRELDAAAMRIKQDRITTIWVPQTEQIDMPSLTVQVNGLQKAYIADKLTSQIQKSYVVQFNITTSGRLYVLKIQEVSKDSSQSGAGR
jgi:conjugal transfer pilus assembly protein TraE